MKKIILFGLILSLVVLAGCGQQKTGTLVLQLTDAPPELDITKALVTISKVEVHSAGSSEDENNTTGDNNTSEAGWFTVVEEPQTFDLIEIKDVNVLLGQADLAAGKYTQVRLSVDKASAVIDGVEYDLKVPSEKVKLIKGFDIVASETTTLTLDFDAQESIHANGKDNYIIRPTIKILQE